MSDYNATRLDAELRAAGLDIGGCSSTGRVDWNSPPSAGDLALAAQVKAAHDPAAKTTRETSIDAIRAKRVLGQSLTSEEILAVIDHFLGVP